MKGSLDFLVSLLNDTCDSSGAVNFLQNINKLIDECFLGFFFPFRMPNLVGMCVGELITGWVQILTDRGRSGRS